MPWWVPVLCVFFGVLLAPFAEYLKGILNSLNTHRYFTRECLAFKNEVFNGNIRAYGSIFEAVQIAYAFEQHQVQFPVRVATPMKFNFFSEGCVNETFFDTFSESEQRLVRRILENVSYLNDRAEYLSNDLKKVTSADSLFLINDISKLVILYIDIEMYLDPDKKRDDFGKIDDFSESRLNKFNFSMHQEKITENLVNKYPQQKAIFEHALW